MPDHTPRRIVSLQPSATVILAALGCLDRVVACTKYCADVVPELARHPHKVFADSWNADATEILAAHPDLVIAAVPYQEKSVIEILKTGTRFLGLAPRTLADIYTDIATIAGAVGAIAHGKAVILEMQRGVEEIRSRTANLPRPRVFCEEWGKPLIASQAWVAELVQAAGGEFLGAPGQQISFAEVKQLNPDMIIAAWCGAGDRVPLEKIIVDRGWQETHAAQNFQVYCIADEFLNTPAPTLLQGLNALAFALHPEAFPAARGIRRIHGSRVPAVNATTPAI
jgi:iron complex transport system substrate-binding protein